MTASAVVAVLMTASAVVAVLMSASATVAVMVTAVAAARHLLDECLHLLLCGLAVLNDGTGEVQHLSCQRVVGVDGHAVFLDLLHFCHEALVVRPHQCDDSTLEDVVVVEMAVDREDLASQLVHSLGIVGAEGLCRLESEVEGCAFLMLDDFLLEAVEGDAKACDKLEGAFLACLFLEVLLVVSDGI